jgi:hypothetical protein
MRAYIYYVVSFNQKIGHLLKARVVFLVLFKLSKIPRPECWVVLFLSLVLLIGLFEMLRGVMKTFRIKGGMVSVLSYWVCAVFKFSKLAHVIFNQASRAISQTRGMLECDWSVFAFTCFFPGFELLVFLVSWRLGIWFGVVVLNLGVDHRSCLTFLLLTHEIVGWRPL